jgi:hypothetical protein
MTRKKAEPMVSKSRTLAVEMKPGESLDSLAANISANPHILAASVVSSYGKASWGEISLTELVGILRGQAVEIKGGDLSHAEAMLCGQAAALNSIFAELARRAAVNIGEYVGAAEIYLKLALRAQNQCRATLETLAAIKNPPVVFAKQANIAHGHQQVINGEPDPSAHAEQIENEPNELLECEHGKRLDTRTAGTAGGSDPTVEAVEVIHRPANRFGQSER